MQSGKTANFTALIAKAYDAGYRIVTCGVPKRLYNFERAGLLALLRCRIDGRGQPRRV